MGGADLGASDLSGERSASADLLPPEVFLCLWFSYLETLFLYTGLGAVGKLAAVSIFSMRFLFCFYPETAQSLTDSLPLSLFTLSLSVVGPCACISCHRRSLLHRRAEQPAPPGQVGTISTGVC